MAKKLTPKQQRFVEEYLVDLNATQAAIRAGYSEKTAYSYGHENLKKPEIQHAVDAAIKRQQERTQVTADKVLEELAKIGFSDIRGAFDEYGNLKRPESWDDKTAAAISSIEVVTKNLGDGEVEYIHKIRLWDKKGSLELIGKHFKMFTDKFEGTVEQKEQ
jgi:phage terminase small subunit